MTKPEKFKLLDKNDTVKLIKMYEKKGVVLKNIVKITCECGVRFSPDYKERHLKTNFHKRYIENDPAYTTKEVISKSVIIFLVLRRFLMNMKIIMVTFL